MSERPGPPDLAGMTVEQAHRAGAAFLRGDGAADAHDALLDARVLLQHVLGWSHARLIAEGGAPLPADTAAAYGAALVRRAGREPAAYITGHKEFWGMTFRVRPGVLIPRPDSETLIEAAKQAFAARAPRRILDMGTGSGALLCVLLKEFPQAEGFACDISETAVRCARDNAAALGMSGRARIFRGDWADALDAGEAGFDLVVSNPPYIPDADRGNLPPDVVMHEPAQALFGGADGLAPYREILAAAPRLVAPGGALILEIGAGCEGAVCTVAGDVLGREWRAPEMRCDLAGRVRSLVLSRS